MTAALSKREERRERGRVSRADLVACLGAGDGEALDFVAGFMGYVRIEPPKKEKPRAQPKGKPGPSASAEAQRMEAGLLPLTFWRVVGHRAKEEKPEPEPELPAWETQPPISLDELRGNPELAPPAKQPLVPWSGFWPFLHRALARPQTTSTLDLPRVVGRIARGQSLDPLPRRKRKYWNPNAEVILDFSGHLLPFWEDLVNLAERLERFRGRSGLKVWALEAGADGPCHLWGRKDRSHASPGEEPRYPLPAPGASILVLSDLGCLQKEDHAKASWRRFGQRLRAAGFSPIALMPCPPEYWDPALAESWRMVCWDRGKKLPVAGRLSGQSRFGAELPDLEFEKRADRLLALLSPAVRVEPALLRAVRHLLPPWEADVGSEALAWSSAKVNACEIGFSFDPEALDTLRESFSREPEWLRKRVLELLALHHRHLSPAILWEELMNGMPLCGESIRPEDSIMAQRLLKTMEGSDSTRIGGINDWLLRLMPRQSSAVWRAVPLLGVLWAKMNYEAWQQGKVQPPKGLDIDKVLRYLGSKKGLRHFSMQRKNGAFLIERSQDLALEAGPWQEQGSPVVTFSCLNPALTVSQVFDREGEGTRESFEGERFSRQALNLDVSDRGFPVPEGGRLVLETERENFLLSSLIKPEWAMGIGRDGDGLFVTLGEGKSARRAYWWNPGRYPVSTGDGHSVGMLALARGFWLDEPEFQFWQNPGIRLPEWADSAGIDSIGMYADAALHGVIQRFRWISPGTFLMGSPEDEADRDSDETLHRVVLTRSFWLAETTCSQALWEAVMGSNPSRFKGKLRPVENVSWEGCADFIAKINTGKRGLALRLPTEAEWEYACRAGTASPFLFGQNITTDQANYDGNYPYADGKKGEYREETVEVKALPCNDWGLYQMHGNVYEWCGDWYGNYPKQAVPDPQGPEQGEVRVLRGGGWIGDGGNVRSAFRNVDPPGYRYDNGGFRLARGQIALSMQASESGPDRPRGARSVRHGPGKDDP